MTAALAAQLQQKIRASQADLAARMDLAVRSAGIATIRDELFLLDCAPWGVRTGTRHAELGTELEVLRSAAA